MRWCGAALVGTVVRVAAVVVTAASARAEPPNGAATGDFSVASRRHAAFVVLIGDAGDDPELAALLGELLARQRVDATLARAERFEPEALFAEREGGTLRVFVALKGPHEARLYFRAPQGERYLVRRIALASGLDAVGRELVGQVVASSTEALLAAEEGLSREQATAALADEGANATEPTKNAVAPLPSRPAPDLRPADAAPRGALEWHLAARYAAEWLGSDFGLRHGPALTAGLRFVRPTLTLGGELGAEYGFEQRCSTAEVDVRRREPQIYGLFEAGLPLGRRGRLTFGAGPRLEISEVRLTARSPAVTVEAPPVEVRVGARAELGSEWAFGHVSVGGAALADIAFLRTHYDVSHASGAATELASVSRFRPGGAVWIGVH